MKHLTEADLAEIADDIKDFDCYSPDRSDSMCDAAEKLLAEVRYLRARCDELTRVVKRVRDGTWKPEE